MNQINGVKKKWVKNKIVDEFKEKILLVNPRPKQRFIRKTYNALYKAVENSDQITWHELYATAGLDYESIKREPPVWTFKRFVDELRKIYENGEDIHPTYLAQNHNNFYRQLRRYEKSEQVKVEDVYKAIGVNYRDISRQKKYIDEESIRKGLIRMISSDHIQFPFTPTDVRVKDNLLYKEILKRGGSFEEGCKAVGLKHTQKEIKLPQYRFSLNEKKKIMALYGHRFEQILDEIFNLLKQPIKRNGEIIKGSKPDFIHETGETWIDAKLTTRITNVSLRDREDGYHLKVKKVIYVYLVPTESLTTDVPENVEVHHVSFYVNQMKKNKKRSVVEGRILEILDIVTNLGIDFTL